MSANFPAWIVDVGAGQDYTIFTFRLESCAKAQDRAEAYAKKYLRPNRISHAIYIMRSEEEFDAMIKRRNQ